VPFYSGGTGLIRTKQLEAKMQIRDTSLSFGFTSILLHWISAGLVAVIFVLGQIAEDMSRGPDKIELMSVHQSLGMLLLIIVLARLLWRLGQGFPDPVGDQKDLLVRLSRLWHWLLLGFIIVLPLSGYLVAETGRGEMTFFGIVPLPDLIGSGRGVHEFFEEIHETLAGLLVPLVIVHVLAALKHHYLDRDATLSRMLGMPHKA
jgi:cytochrome b561